MDTNVSVNLIAELVLGTFRRGQFYDEQTSHLSRGKALAFTGMSAMLVGISIAVMIKLV